ncbi:MAG: DUF5678 domain-containing protein [Isosphaeraceae bacterium]
MSDATTCSALNLQAARRINDAARKDPDSPFAGKFVGIVAGQVVASGDDPDEVVERLRQIEPDPSRTFCFEAGLDYDRVEDIWAMR